MAAYLIANVDVHDADAYEEYRSRTGEIVKRHGGHFIVRGGKVHVLEGDPGVHRLVVIEFPDAAAAKRFYSSPEYQEIIPLRTGVSDAALLVVEGVDA